MMKSDFEWARYQISFTAGMNQRYHQKLADKWWKRDTIAKAATAILSVIGAMVASAAIYPKHSIFIDYIGLIVSVLAAISAVVLNIIPFGAWEKDHRILFKQWTDIRKEADLLAYSVSHDHQGPIDTEELKKLESRVHMLCGDEPAPNEKMLNTCFNEEEKSRKAVAA